MMQLYLQGMGLKYVCCLVMVMFLNTLQGQYMQFPRLEKLYLSGKYADCVKSCEKVLEKEKNRNELEPHRWLMLSYIKLAEGNDAEFSGNAVLKALKEATRIRKRDKQQYYADLLTETFPGLEDLALQKIQEYEDAGKPQKAQPIYDILQQSFGSYKVRYKLAMKLFDEGMGYDALDPFESLIRDINTDAAAPKMLLPELYGHVIDCYQMLGDHNKAYQVWRIAYGHFPGQNMRAKGIELAYARTRTYSYDAAYLDLLRRQAITTDSLLGGNTDSLKQIVVFSDSLLVMLYLRGGTNDVFSNLYELEQLSPKTHNLSANIHWLSDMYVLEGTDRKKLTNLLLDYKRSGVQKNAAVIKDIFDMFDAAGNYEACIQFTDAIRAYHPDQKAVTDGLQKRLSSKFSAMLRTAEADEKTLRDATRFLSLSPADKTLILQKYNISLKLARQYLALQKFSPLRKLLNRAMTEYPGDAAFAELQKQMIEQDYLENYRPSIITNLDLSGMSTEQCKPGVISKESNHQFLNMLNYARRLAGIYDSCILSDDLNDKAQSAALIMHANYRLSHGPSSDWKCYSEKGAAAAGHSNLSLGHGGTYALWGQIQDAGESNGACGHRRWILNPNNCVFGFGSTTSAMALYVFGSGTTVQKPPVWNKDQYVAWPAAGYFPSSLIFHRWSFSMSGMEFDNAKVSVTKDGKAVKLKILKPEYGYGLPTLVWEIEEDITDNAVYKVTVSNIISKEWMISGGQNIKVLSYIYTVIPLHMPSY